MSRTGWPDFRPKDQRSISRDVEFIGDAGRPRAWAAYFGLLMPTLQFKGKTVIETYHHTVPHHRLEVAAELSVLEKGQKAGLEGNLIIEGTICWR